MGRLFGAALIIVAAVSFSQLGGASEPRSEQATLASIALSRADVDGCGDFRVVESDRFLKRIGIICEDGRSHWISHEGSLKVDGRDV